MIVGWVGNLGSGKTWGMVRKAWQEVKSRPRHTPPPLIFSNMSNIAFPMSIYCQTFEDMQRIACGLILFDEAGVWLDSRSWQSVPKGFLQRLVQFRKRRLDLYYTAQGFDQVDSRLRMLTNVLHKCMMITLPPGFFLQFDTDPKGKSITGFNAALFSVKVAALYDTYEVQADPLKGRGNDVEISWQEGGGRQADPFDELSDEYAEGRSFEATIRRKREGGLNVRWTEAEEVTRAYLMQIGRYQPQQAGWPDMWRYALRRTRWLRMFRIHPAEVPLWVCRESPWLIPPPPAVHSQSRKYDHPTLSELNNRQVNQLIQAIWHPRSPFELGFTVKMVETMKAAEAQEETGARVTAGGVDYELDLNL